MGLFFLGNIISIMDCVKFGFCSLGFVIRKMVGVKVFVVCFGCEKGVVDKKVSSSVVM